MQERAEKLLGGLGGEQVRWTAAAAQLRADAKHVIGHALLSAAVMAYLGPFTPVFRRAVLAGVGRLCAAQDTGMMCPRASNAVSVLRSPVVSLLGLGSDPLVRQLACCPCMPDGHCLWPEVSMSVLGLGA